MRDIDLFQLALGLVPPRMVVDAKFGGRFACPDCGKADCPVHDTVKKTSPPQFLSARDLPARTRRPYRPLSASIDCLDCGVRLVNVPWARPGSSFTLRFEAFVMALVKDMPVAAALRKAAGFGRWWETMKDALRSRQQDGSSHRA